MYFQKNIFSNPSSQRKPQDKLIHTINEPFMPKARFKKPKSTHFQPMNIIPPGMNVSNENYSQVKMMMESKYQQM